jgi:hypothetical protein
MAAAGFHIIQNLLLIPLHPGSGFQVIERGPVWVLAAFSVAIAGVSSVAFMTEPVIAAEVLELFPAFTNPDCAKRYVH